MKKTLLFCCCLLYAMALTAREVVYDRIERCVFRDSEVVPETIDDWIVVLDSILTDKEKKDLKKFKYDKEDEYYPQIYDYLLSTDFLERACVNYIGNFNIPRFLKKRDIDLSIEFYYTIMEAYIKHLKGKPYKMYYDFPDPKSFDEFIAVLEAGGWPEAVKVLKKPVNRKDEIWIRTRNSFAKNYELPAREKELIQSVDEYYVAYLLEDGEDASNWDFTLDNVIYEDVDSQDRLTALAESIKALSDYDEMQPEAIKRIISIAAHRHFAGKEINWPELMARHEKYRMIPFHLSTTNDHVDSINGVYVPVDVVDACRELDKLLDDSTKTKIVELGKELPVANRSLGMWIRNNWGLWRGSRLTAYLRERVDGGPDAMSAYILTRYQFWLECKAKQED